MEAEIIESYPDTPAVRTIKYAAEILRKGGIIVYPTDTIYGIGIDPYNKKAMERVLRIKKASAGKPLSFILSDLKDISTYALVPDFAYKIMRRVTPGPYTFVLNATKEVPKIMFHKRKTVGIRIPLAPLATELVNVLGHPILSTSVPMGENEFHTDPREILAQFGHAIDLILDAGVLFNNPSTIVDFTSDEPLILREGAGDIDALNY